MFSQRWLKQIKNVEIGARIKIFPANHSRIEEPIIGKVLFKKEEDQQMQVLVRMERPALPEVRSFGQGTIVGEIYDPNKDYSAGRGGDFLF